MFSKVYSLSVVATFLLLCHSASALPRPNVIETSELVGRSARAERCSMLDLDDAQSLPGWRKLEAYARKKWGEGDWSITINPQGYKDKPATMCIAELPAVVTSTGHPNCTEDRVDIPPQTKGSNTIPVNEGFTNRGNWNITNVTTAAHAEFFQATFQLPNITKLALGSMKAVGAFINAPDNSFVTTATNVTIRNVELTPVPDKHCIGTILDQICITPAKGRIQLIASGYIWFNYKTKRAPLAHPKGGKHSRYTVKIEDVLNTTERSAWLSFNGYMNTSMRYDYYDECRWDFKL